MQLKGQELARRLDTTSLLRLRSKRGTEHDAEAPETARLMVRRTEREIRGKEREKKRTKKWKENHNGRQKVWKLIFRVSKNTVV